MCFQVSLIECFKMWFSCYNAAQNYGCAPGRSDLSVPDILHSNTVT
jgi:hypothetical protein